MAESKWITGLTPTMPVEAAARRVLTMRLEAVRSLWRPAVEAAAQDVEHVHQLRVATRRCRAALDLFAGVLPDKVYERLRRLLRNIRRAAGPARDADVIFLDLAARLKKATSRTTPGLHWVAGQIAARRTLAQERLQARHTELARELRQAMGDLRSGRHGADRNGQPSRLIELAGDRILALFVAVETAGRGNLDQEQLHALRIEGKRLRYAMEVFGDCFAPAFRESLYPLVESMQEHLGEVNDAHVALTTLDAMRTMAQAYYPQHWPSWQPGVNSLRSGERQRLKRERQRFERFWASWQKQGVRGHFLKVVNEAVSVPAGTGP
jgi:CHAD domain-containing protein